MRILFLLNKYMQQRQKDQATWIYPIKLAMYATALRNQGNKVIWDGKDDGSFDKVITSEKQIDIPFLQLPHADRILTNALNPKWMQNGNFKFLPGTYLQSANGCFWGRCNFCVESGGYAGKPSESRSIREPALTRDSAGIPPPYLVRPVKDCIEEIQECVALGIREIFDDSGTFPVGDWLKVFCQLMISTGLNKQVTLGCNMRFGALDLEDFDLMKRAGFRMILWGLESVNQDTLDRLNKGIQFEWVLPELFFAKRVGLHSHLAVMFGYPWETKEDEQKTFDFVKRCLLTNLVKTAQASIYDVEEWDNSSAPYEKAYPSFAFDFRKKVYALYHNPRYLWYRIKEIRNWDDIEYYLRGVKKLWGRK